MLTTPRHADAGTIAPQELEEAVPFGKSALWTVERMTRAQISAHHRWLKAFSGQRKDRRYYELVEDTINQGFEFGYFVIKDGRGEIRAFQPFFVTDQDLLDGTGPKAREFASAIRRIWPRLLRMRTLMIGCAAGEAHLDAGNASPASFIAESLASAIIAEAEDLGTKLIVFKEFTEADRKALSSLLGQGFTRVPSMPMTRLRLNYTSFADYMQKALRRNTRSQLRRKFRD